MIAIATSKGIVLAFASPNEARGVGRQLIDMAEWFETQNRPSPLLYSQYDEAIPAERMQSLLAALKDVPLAAVRGGASMPMRDLPQTRKETDR